MRNIKLISYSKTQAIVAGSIAAALTGDSLTIPGTKRANILAWWALNQAVGFHQMKAASLHDREVGDKQPVGAGAMHNLVNRSAMIPVQAQEDLSFVIGGANTSGDVDTGCFLLETHDTGLGGNYMDFDELYDRADWSKRLTLFRTLAASAAGYGTEENIVAEDDPFWGGKEYGLLGITTTANVAAAYIVGNDTGGVRFGCPGNAVDAYPPGGDWFCELSRVLASKTILKFNTANRRSTSVGFIADENVTSLTAGFHFVMLR